MPSTDALSSRADKEEDLEASTGPRIHHVETHVDDPDLIRIGDSWISRSELQQAFGGTLNPGVSYPPSRKFANPAPLGLSAFGLTTFVLSMANAGARGNFNGQVVVGLAYFYGGFIQLLAGMWEMVLENTFGATALSSYGGFWMAFAAINTDAFGIVSSYGDDLYALNSMLGFFLMGWFLFTTMMVLCTLRATIAFFMLFFTLDLAFLCLSLSHFIVSSTDAANVNLTRAGGIFGLLSAFLAFYNAYAGVASPENALFVVKGFPMPWNRAYQASRNKRSS
ncbi:GPR1/FUN34/yaaH family-domain-containing protein [Lipomyces arxii]|uniref:GPR1/FUN34/yaaH family-domain-containing protein n=1 Tax=Lipomyces arxii TaxID=56418 RepID=UPI0034CDB1AA